jgi:hypothetical protein
MDKRLKTLKSAAEKLRAARGYPADELLTSGGGLALLTLDELLVLQSQVQHQLEVALEIRGIIK